MEDALKKALDFANYKQSFAIQRKTLKEKFQSSLIYGHNGGMFTIDLSLMAYVTTLIDAGRTSNVVLIDNNQNPILIENLSQFKDEIVDRYFNSSVEYFEKYQALKKSRTVEKLL